MLRASATQAEKRAAIADHLVKTLIIIPPRLNFDFYRNSLTIEFKKY
jgi:hypothetical protein